MSGATLGSVRPRAAPAKVRHMASGSLVVKATAGKNDPERCNQALTVAATAVASGVPVSLWLTGEASWLGIPGRAEEISLAHASPATDMLATILRGGMITVCTQCAARREITQEDLIEGVRIAGAPTFIAEVMAEGAKPLIY
jgi:predicted peroxiredoxin